MSAFTFQVPGPVRGKGRPRFGKEFAYTDAKTRSYEALIAFHAHEAMAGAALLDGALSVAAFVYIDPPASWSKARRARALAGQELPTKKPDLDNCIKALMDALNGVVWHDDVQVVNLDVTKAYAAAPGLHVAIEPARLAMKEAA